MSTLSASQRIILNSLRLLIKALTDREKQMVDIFWVIVIGGTVASVTGVAGYFILSGQVLTWLAEIMVWACHLSGSCVDFPAMLTGLAVGVVILFIPGLVIYISFHPSPDATPTADEISQISLLLDWYRIGTWERGDLLDKLDSTEIETSYRVRRWLELEHRELEAMDGGH